MGTPKVALVVVKNYGKPTAGTLGVSAVFIPGGHHETG
jgi:hypothetical protein